MRAIVLTAILLTLPGFAWSQTAPADGAATEDPVIKYAEETVPRALNFTQGDRASLLDARGDFTPKGWGAFLQRLNGWLDDHGAPNYTSTFKHGERPAKRHPVDGGSMVTIYGELKQESRNEHGGVSTTTYQVAVDATISPNPLKIDLLEQRTCGKTPCD